MSVLKEVLFNDGEGLDYTDLNIMQRNARSAITDGVVRPAMTNIAAPFDHLANVVYGRGRAGGIRVVSGLQVGNWAGPIMIERTLTNPTGNDVNILTCWLAQDDLATTLATADPTNPRLDVIYVKLDQVEGVPTSRDFKDATSGVLSSTTVNKQRAVVVSKGVLTGTPAPTPTEPTGIPSGYTKYASVLVPAGASSINALTGLRDYRVPTGMRIDTMPGQALFFNPNTPTTAWSQPASGATNAWDIKASGAGAVAYAIPQHVDFESRLLSITIAAQLTGATVLLVRNNLLDNSTGATLLDLSSTFGTMSSLLTFDFSPTSPLPYWGCGHSSANQGSFGDVLGLYISAGSSSDKIQYVRFDWAGGW